jgi:hypothetical protein
MGKTNPITTKDLASELANLYDFFVYEVEILRELLVNVLALTSFVDQLAFQIQRDAVAQQDKIRQIDVLLQTSRERAEALRQGKIPPKASVQ